MKRKKLIRDEVAKGLPSYKVATIESQDELNQLYVMKVKEELAEVVNSDFKDITEFADLLHVVVCFSRANGHPLENLLSAMSVKQRERGLFSNKVLTDINPLNESNKIYTEES